MNIANLFFLLTFSFLSGCFAVDTNITSEKNQEINPGSIPINYYADKTVKSLEIPPDLTKPDTENSFRISEFASNISEDIIDFSNSETAKDSKTKILQLNTDIEVKRAGDRRWLLVNKDSDTLWNLSKEFLQQRGFTIKKSNKKLGILETDFLENYPDVPQKNLGMIRKYLQDALKARYALPILDKYRVRIEPVSDDAVEQDASQRRPNDAHSKVGSLSTNTSGGQ